MAILEKLADFTWILNTELGFWVNLREEIYIVVADLEIQHLFSTWGIRSQGLEDESQQDNARADNDKARCHTVREHLLNKYNRFSEKRRPQPVHFTDHMELARLIVMNKLKTKANSLASLA